MPPFTDGHGADARAIVLREGRLQAPRLSLLFWRPGPAGKGQTTDLISTQGRGPGLQLGAARPHQACSWWTLCEH